MEDAMVAKVSAGGRMFNPYGIIIGLFITGGLVISLWGWTLIARTRRMRRWTVVEGIVETGAPGAPADDLALGIVFTYQVDGKNYRHTLDYPPGAMPTPELCGHYRTKYPAGARVALHYDPRQPQTTVLDPGLGRGDWLIFLLGAGATLLGIIMLFI